MIQVRCVCGKKIRAKPELAGRKVKCPACSQSLVLPIPKPQTQDLGQVNLAELEDQAVADDPLGALGDASDPLGGVDPLGAGALGDLPNPSATLQGYDQIGGGQAPQPKPAKKGSGKATRPKRAKKGSGKAGVFIAVGAGGIIVVVVVVVVLVMLTKSFFADPHERAMKELIELTEQCAVALESITDANSTDAAAKTIKQVSRRYKVLNRDAREFDDPSPEMEERIKKEFEPKLKALQKRIIAGWSGLGAKPQLAARLANAIGNTGELPRSMLPSTGGPLGLDTFGQEAEPVRIGR